MNRINIKNKNWIHLLLFGVTFITTVIAGIEWTTGTMGPYEFTDLSLGLPYAISILIFLSAHEFGHYFAARIHGVSTTLPFYIPFPPIMGMFNFGTMGAVIKIKERIPSNKAMFDIGVAGPLAGFIAAIGLLVYGFSNLPGIEYLLKIHPDYLSPEYGKNGLELYFGNTIIFSLLKDLFASQNQFIPPMTEVYHYPYLCVGWFGLFVTAMNMIPVGQLDGGHVIYGMFGEKIHEIIATISLSFIAVLGFTGLLDMLLELNLNIGWTGWLFWSLILYFVIKVKHPPALVYNKLNKGRMVIGILSIIILIISFSPSPFVINILE